MCDAYSTFLILSSGLWSGYETACLLSIVPALTFYMTNFIQRATLPAHVLNPPPATKNANGKRSETVGPTALQTFLTSAAGNAACTLIVFPLILSKTRLQWKSPSGKRVYRSFVDVVRKTMRRSGWTGLYQGLNSQLIKGFISHGVTMVRCRTASSGELVAKQRADFSVPLRAPCRWSSNGWRRSSSSSTSSFGIARPFPSPRSEI